MFDLEQALRSWRRHLGRVALLTASELDELENHLYDEMELLEADGVAAEAAFHTAVERLGDADSLRREFSKNGSTSRRLFAGLRLLFILPLTVLWSLFVMEGFPGGEISLDFIIVNSIDLFGRALVYLAGIWLAVRSRQWIWAVLFVWLLAMPWILNYLIYALPHWNAVLPGWSMYVWLLTKPTVLLLSIFWVYPPAFALDLRRRLAPAWGTRRRTTGLWDEGPLGLVRGVDGGEFDTKASGVTSSAT